MQTLLNACLFLTEIYLHHNTYNTLILQYFLVSVTIRLRFIQEPFLKKYEGRISGSKTHNEVTWFAASERTNDFS